MGNDSSHSVVISRAKSKLDGDCPGFNDTKLTQRSVNGTCCLGGISLNLELWDQQSIITYRSGLEISEMNKVQAAFTVPEMNWIGVHFFKECFEEVLNS